MDISAEIERLLVDEMTKQINSKIIKDLLKIKNRQLKIEEILEKIKKRNIISP